MDGAEWTVSLGEGNEQLRERFSISRARQDEFAARSHRLAAAAWDDGFYDDLVVPVEGVDLPRDESIRHDSTAEKLAALQPSFRRDGSITASNASPLNDGATALLLGSEAAAERLGLEPLARIAGRGAFALEPQAFGYAPVEAANIALERAGIGWAQVDAVELNEAFAVQSLACVDAWMVDPEIVNVKGGAIAIGHPLGASGARILGTLAKVLAEKGVCAARVDRPEGPSSCLPRHHHPRRPGQRHSTSRSEHPISPISSEDYMITMSHMSLADRD
ncbi:thiolase family protein [Nocardia sp. NPDC005366]|uniref:thiolase family protein n=1 Tax=Nocardia sp. NPDC005366 TaxID=3156878 RepID=UPI0033AC0760